MSESTIFNMVYDLYNEYVEREYINRNIKNEVDGECTENYNNYFSDCHSYLMRLLRIFYDQYKISLYYDLCNMIY